jgi:alpha-tubulin suppressor-like RCC1 family protein
MILKHRFILIFLLTFILIGCQESAVNFQAADNGPTDTQSETPAPLPDEEPPTAPSTYATLSDQLYLGIEGNACGIDSTGQLKCWGANHDSSDAVYGLLGTGDATGSSLTTPQDVNAGTAYIAISVGELTVCAITNTNVTQCWGQEWAAGDTNHSGADILTPTDIDDTDSYTTITSGSYHNCGITTDNHLKCWGDTWDGKLGRVGDNETPLRSDAPNLYIQVAAGRNHTCGITSEKKLRCWGTNSSGQVGVGSTVNPQVPVEIDPGVSYKYISVQENNTCAITSLDKLKCWGTNASGQVGNGTTGGVISTPTIIDAATNYKQVQVGNYHTCGITSTDQLKCWGSNGNGRLGDGTTIGPVNTPKAIDAANTYKKVYAGGSYTCALRMNGDLYCWGRNDRGQTGDGTTVEKHIPTLVELGFN